VKNLIARLTERDVPVPSEALLLQALTHRSASANNYERLEFLGDALLDFICAELLHERFPKADEGSLSRLRSALVEQSALASYAQVLHLSEHLILGSGELKSGGFRRESILADVVESITAAIYMDHGLAGAKRFLTPLLEARIPEAEQLANERDGKTRLQEYLQANGQALPSYSLIAQSGPEHERNFTVVCMVNGTTETGEGTSLKRAEQRAAGAMLQRLQAQRKQQLEKVLR
jgi:ribonuclease III